MVGSPPFFCFFVTIYGSPERTVKLTSKEIQQIIKEELNRVIKESQEIYSVVAAIQRAFKFNKGSEDEKKKLVNKLFDAYESISPNESEFAKKWIDIFYKEYKGFQKVVNADKLLKYRYFHPPPKPEFVSSLNPKDISDTSYIPTGITTHDSEQYLRQQDKERRRFKGKNLAGHNFRASRLRHFDFSGANLSGANLSESDWTGANFSGADLSGADLGASVLKKADLSGANLSGANLRISWLNGADLSGANLEEADLKGSWLGGANLTKANLTGANLSRVFYDDKAQWPKGFDPTKAGATKK